MSVNFRQYDWGRTIEIRFVDEDGTAIDLSVADEIRYRFKLPDGTYETVTPSLGGQESEDDDGTDGWTFWAITDGFLSQARQWTVEAWAQKTGEWELTTAPHKFTVDPVLGPRIEV